MSDDIEGNIQGIDIDPETGEGKSIFGGVQKYTWWQNWFVKEAICEAIATALFVFVGAGAEFNTVVLTDIALAHGAAIAFLVSATAKTSGGHLNPAVTFAAWVMRRIGWKQMLIYWGSQLFGATIGSLLLMAATNPLTWGRLGSQTLSGDTNAGQGILWEFILTFVLVFVVSGVALRPADTMGKHAPWLIGLTVISCILAGSTRSGSSMNPARTFGML